MSTVVLASAGTGKTHTLVDAWLRALLGLDDGSAKAAETLLAITFTEKAAAEMRSRIERRLARLRFTPDEEDELVAAFAAAGLAVPAGAALDAARRSISRAPIGTFHSMCGRILREHALAADLDPSFRILEPDEEQRMLGELAEAVIVDALAVHDPVVRELVARIPLRGLYEQRGLTESLVAVHASLAERGLAPSTLQATPPGIAVAAAVDRVRAAAAAVAATGAKNIAVRLQQTGLRLDQILRLCAAVSPVGVIDGAVDGGVDGAVDGAVDVDGDGIDDDGDVEAALARLFAELKDGVSGTWGGNAITDKRRALVDAIEGVGAALVDHLMQGTAPGVRKLLVELDRRQRREKEQRAVLGFGDLLVRTRDLLASDKSVRARVKARFHRVFVDEYQDTSPVQEQVVALLVEDPAAGTRLDVNASPFAQVKVPAKRAFIVGDPKQSIYGFRGADPDVFARAVSDLPDRVLQRLTISRRSTAAVCAFINGVTRSVLPGHADEVLLPLTEAAPTETTTVGAWWRPGPSWKPRGLPSVELDALLVSSRLVALLQQQHTEAAPLEPGDVVVLVRRGRAAAIIGRALAERGVPVRVVGGDGFWRRPEVQDLVSALSLVVDPRDDLAALAVLRSPLVAVPDDQILALFEAGAGLGASGASDGNAAGVGAGFSWPAIVEAAGDALVDSAVAARIRAFDAVILSIRARLATEPLTRAIDVLLDEGGYAVACAVEPDAALRLRHVEKLRALCAGRPEEGMLAIARLTDALDDPPPEPVLFPSDDENGPSDNAVRIMTIHQSKGLEANVVVLADAGVALRNEGDDVLFDPAVGLAVSARGRPIHRCSPRATATEVTAIQRVRRAKKERDERELRRLLYVALTRARRGIFVCGSPRRRGPTSLLGLLEQARDLDLTAWNAFLPETLVEEADALPPVRFRPALADRPAKAAASDVGGVAGVGSVAGVGTALRRPRLRASALMSRATPQLAIGFASEAESLDDDVLPPRARGRLAHAVIGLVAGEQPEATVDVVRCRAAVIAALQATGAPQQGGVTAVDADLIERLVVTLCGPVRGLIEEGRELVFEEPLVLLTDVVVVEGTADLLARSAKDTVVVEFKLSKAAASSPSSLAQVQACCAALAQRDDQPLRFAVWSIGDPSPRPPVPFGPPARRELASLLARITVAP